MIRLIYFLNFCTLLFTVGYAHSASFDCNKASTRTEHLICSDEDLSLLDSKLGLLFGSIKDKTKTLIGGQRKWLADKRAACQSIDCLKNVYAQRIKELKKFDGCPLTLSNLVGSWVRKQGDGFEEMAFTDDKINKYFTSWIHHQPEMTGFWDYSQCEINIKHSTEEKIQFELKVKAFSKGLLTLVDTDSGNVASYRKTK